MRQSTQFLSSLSRLTPTIAVAGATVIGMPAASAAAGDGGIEQALASASAGTVPPPAEGHDVVCSWGRLANGRGALVRCLTAAEARALLGATSRGSPSADAHVELATASGSAANVEALLGTVVFEGERLAAAAPAFASLRASYQGCVAKHGGLNRASGEVRIRFHVDAHGLTREASVSRRRVLSKPAAQCIARASEHRFVGVPTTGAAVGTLVVHLSRGSQ